MFVHAWQPRIRARPENGWKSLIPAKHPLTTAAVFALLCTTALATVAVDGSGADEDISNMRLGPSDVNIDIIEVHSLWDPVRVEVSNVGEHHVHAIILHRSLVVEHVDRGTVDWESIVSSLSPNEFQDLIIDPGQSWETEVSTPSIFDTHLVLVKSAYDGEFSEIRITMHYVDDELIWSAILLSVPAFLITGLVIDQSFRRSEDEMGEQATDEEA
jgi:hypothetical protein